MCRNYSLWLLINNRLCEKYFYKCLLCGTDSAVLACVCRRQWSSWWMDCTDVDIPSFQTREFSGSCCRQITRWDIVSFSSMGWFNTNTTYLSCGCTWYFTSSCCIIYQILFLTSTSMYYLSISSCLYIHISQYIWNYIWDEYNGFRKP